MWFLNTVLFNMCVNFIWIRLTLTTWYYHWGPLLHCLWFVGFLWFIAHQLTPYTWKWYQAHHVFLLDEFCPKAHGLTWYCSVLFHSHPEYLLGPLCWQERDCWSAQGSITSLNKSFHLMALEVSGLLPLRPLRPVGKGDSKSSVLSCPHKCCRIQEIRETNGGTGGFYWVSREHQSRRLIP